MKISFWKKDKIVFTKFKTEQKLYKFLSKHSIHTFKLNGITNVIIGEIKR